MEEGPVEFGKDLLSTELPDSSTARQSQKPFASAENTELVESIPTRWAGITLRRMKGCSGCCEVEFTPRFGADKTEELALLLKLVRGDVRVAARCTLRTAPAYSSLRHAVRLATELQSTEAAKMLVRENPYERLSLDGEMAEAFVPDYLVPALRGFRGLPGLLSPAIKVHLAEILCPAAAYSHHVIDIPGLYRALRTHGAPDLADEIELCALRALGQDALVESLRRVREVFGGTVPNIEKVLGVPLEIKEDVQTNPHYAEMQDKTRTLRYHGVSVVVGIAMSGTEYERRSILRISQTKKHSKIPNDWIHSRAEKVVKDLGPPYQTEGSWLRYVDQRSAGDKPVLSFEIADHLVRTVDWRFEAK